MIDTASALQEACDAAGGSAQLAAKLTARGRKTSKASISRWKADGVPLDACPHIEELTGMKMGGGVTPAKTVLTHYPGQNTYFGHTHRRDVYTRPTWKDGRKVAHGAWNGGHLQDEKEAGWSGHNAWEQSFGLIHYYDHDLFEVQLARGARDKRNRPTVLIGGKSYS